MKRSNKMKTHGIMNSAANTATGAIPKPHPVKRAKCDAIIFFGKKE